MSATIGKTLGWSSDVTVELEWCGVSGLVFAELDANEHGRREAAGMGPLRDLLTVRALASLGSQPMPVREVTEIARLSAEPGLMDWCANDMVAAAASPPLRVIGTMVLGRGWRETLSRASKFSLVTRRVAVIDRRPRSLDAALAQAMWFDAGLIVASDERPELLAHPGPVAGDDAAYQWWFSELVYAAHLRLAEAVHRHPAAA